MFDPSLLVATIGLLVLLTAIAVIDFRCMVIPDPLNVCLLFGGLLWTWTRGQSQFLGAILAALVVGGVVYSMRALYFRLRNRQGLGLGDVKFLAAAATWIHWDLLPWLLLIACLSALLFAAVNGLITSGGRYGKLAFGPHLCVGTATTWLFQNLY